MFMLSWIRSSEAQASNNATALVTDHDSVMEDQRQEDWVVLPCDHTDLMEASVSDLDLLSASMTLYRPSASSHPASSRTRSDTTSSSSGASCSPLTGTTAHAGGPGEQTKKSRRQLKQELRHQQAMEELERRPRYDPMIAKMRDHEFKMAKMAKLGLRSGRIMSSSSGGPQSTKSTRSAGGSSAP